MKQPPTTRRRLLSVAALATLGAFIAPRARAEPAAPAPCDDFYEHVNAAWIAATPLPDDRARIGTVDQLEQRNQRVLEGALTAALADRSRLDTPGKRLVVDFYASGMDVAAIERQGTAALQPWLALIDGLVDRAQLPAVIAQLARLDIGAPVNIGVRPDARDKRRHRVHCWQAGLGLPDRDDYFRDDQRARDVRDGYRAYLVRLLTLAGAAQADAVRGAAELMVMETRLANASLKRTEMRDPTTLYNLKTPTELGGRAGGLDWTRLLEELDLRQADAVVVGQPGFINAVNVLARDVGLSTWRTYLRVRLLDAVAPTLPAPWRDAHFAFHQMTLRGVQQRRPRSEEVVRLISGNVGHHPLAEGLGELFVARAFSPLAKARAMTMVEDIKAAMRDRIGRLDWMGAATRERAIAKLDAMVLQIGYPDRWKTYDGLEIDPTDFTGNWLRAWQHETARQFARLSQPVNRREWFASPHIVNAFAGGFNNIVFPAGILQSPFFDAAADDATNFGGIGMVIGHEITHHFDDRGRQFDEVGNLAEWWTAQDAANYKERADRLAAQYAAYAPLPGHPINGVQTLGENISDVGGLKIAYDGLQRALARQPASARSAAGEPTPAQRFFLSYATIWRSKIRAEALITQLRSGQHSPAKYRVLGPLVNMPAFAEAFSCAPGSAMTREAAARITIW